jgi:hypothetical protein
MKMSHFETYKVVECGDFLAIMRPQDNFNDHKKADLIVSDLPTCCEYLARYTYARAGGKSIDDAHREALAGARVIKAGSRDLAQRADG